MSPVLLSCVITLNSRTARHVTSPAAPPTPLKPTGTSCRNLFGPVDHDELRRELTSKLQDIRARDRQRWNFDFSEEKPLDGPLQWSRTRDCPPFYQRTGGEGPKHPKEREPEDTPPNLDTDFYANQRRTISVTPKESRNVE